MKRKEIYPDSADADDVILFAYNRQGQVTKRTDQNGTVHEYNYDALGRPVHDRVTTLGTNVDGSVRRISVSFDVLGRREKITSHSSATVGSGSIINEVTMTYNDFGQLIEQHQSHSGAVNVSTTPKVMYAYEDGSDNTIRPVSITYPNGRVVSYEYGSADGMNDAASRVAALVDDDETTLVEYEYLGLGTAVEVNYPEPNVKLTLADLSDPPANDAGTGDIYSGLDRFGRTKDHRWYNATEEEDVVRLKYGYDRASNRLWKQDTVATALSQEFDELYSYDGVHRLKNMGRGLLNTEHSTLNTRVFEQCWTLDATNNWSAFKEANTGGSWTLDQTREANPVNEITDITNTVGATWAQPTHDQAGNMTTIPKPANPTESFTATYDPWNRLVKLVDNDTEETVQENEYDPRTFRVVRKDYEQGDPSETRHHFYTFNWRHIEERLGVSESAGHHFVWGGRYIDDIVLREVDSNGDASFDERFYGTQDANWNMSAVIDVLSTVVYRYSYTPNGCHACLSGSYDASSTGNTGWEITFCGYFQDTENLLYSVRHRTLNPVVGQWCSRDPMLYDDGPNLFEYGRSSPLSNTDPFGLINKHHAVMSTIIGKVGKACKSLIDAMGVTSDKFRDMFTIHLPGQWAFGSDHWWFHHGQGSNFYKDALSTIVRESGDSCCEILKSIRKLIQSVYADWHNQKYPKGLVGPTWPKTPVFQTMSGALSDLAFDAVIDMACNGLICPKYEVKLVLGGNKGYDVIRIDPRSEPIQYMTHCMEECELARKRREQQEEFNRMMLLMMMIIASTTVATAGTGTVVGPVVETVGVTAGSTIGGGAIDFSGPIIFVIP